MIMKRWGNLLKLTIALMALLVFSNQKVFAEVIVNNDSKVTNVETIEKINSESNQATDKENLVNKQINSEPNTPIIKTPVTNDSLPDLNRDVAAKTGNVKIVKIQYKNNFVSVNKEAAEFLILHNFDAKPIDINGWNIISGSQSSRIATKTTVLNPGEQIFLYNKNFVDNLTGDNLDFFNKLAILKNQFTTASSGSGKLLQKFDYKLVDSESNSIHQIVSRISPITNSDTWVAQTDNEGKFIFSEKDELYFASIQANSEQGMLLNYNVFPIYNKDLKYTNDNQDESPEPGKPVEKIITCAGIYINELGINLDQQFIEIYNPTNKDLTLNGCKIMRNKTQILYEFKNIVLKSNDFLAISDLVIPKTTSGEITIVEGDYDIDLVKYEVQKSNTSWSRFEDNFAQTYDITAGKINKYQKYQTCEEGYEINEATGRCNKIPEQTPKDDSSKTAKASVTLKDNTQLKCQYGYEIGFTGSCVKVCETGYYRSPDSNRCVKIKNKTVTTAKVAALTPCKEGYERNPATNRCVKIKIAKGCDEGYEIGFTGSCVKKCDEGYERAKETNRCRKISSVKKDDSNQKIEQLLDNQDKTLSWEKVLPYGIVGVMSFASFALWDRRVEIATRMRNRK